MISKNKKFFPKLKKKLKWFLTDESWKISKKDALGLAVGAVLLSGVGEVWAIDCTSTPPAAWTFTQSVTVTGTHASWVVNWHYSATPTPTSFCWHWSHGSHGSHWSHGSHGSHGSHWSRW